MPPADVSDTFSWQLDDPAEQELVDRYLDALVEAYLATLLPADRVGQLFVTNFLGDETGPESDIAELIQTYRIGGVVLTPAYGNFVNAKNADTPALVASLANRLQALAFGATLPVDDALAPLDEDELDTAATALPLFVGVEQFGDDVMATALRRNFTELPNQMTLGAGWNPSLAYDVGGIVGRELAAVGVNLLLGPILDVYSVPRTDAVGSLGIFSFGGDAFWVSELGSAYIAGVKAGSTETVATVARHFPGIGSADRLPVFEVATIQDTPETMAQKSLPPFLTVTRGRPSNLTGQSVRTDALMSSHMRYTAYQPTGSGRVPPLGLSPALSMLMEEQGLETWRDDGGLMMTTALGLPAIRRAYDPALVDFPFRRAALDAFTAGNDMIYLGYFGKDGTWASELKNIEETVTFFQSRYADDFGFALQVDDAVRRIIRAKLKLALDPAEVLASAERLVSEGVMLVAEAGADALPLTMTEIPPAGTIVLTDLLSTPADLALFDDESVAMSEAERIVQQVARESITILYPDPLTVTDTLPPPLQSDEQVVIFTDLRWVKECATCLADISVGPEEIGDIILKLYGPEGTGQVAPDQLKNYTFGELAEILETGEEVVVDEEPSAGIAVMIPALEPSVAISATEIVTSSQAVTVTTDPQDRPQPAFTVNIPPSPPQDQSAGDDKFSRIERDIDDADWIIFAMLNVDPGADPDSDIVKRFLRQRGEQVEGKQVVVLALQAPNFLDATEISQLSTYLGVYSHSTTFLEMAVRTLFRGIVPAGAPPLSVSGTRFDNLTERLQPDAQVQMPLQVLVDGQVVVNTATLALESQDAYIANSVTVEVGPIIDYNGNLVADNTPVEFQIAYEGKDLAVSAEPALTRQGIASRDLLLSESGTLSISARSGEASTGPPITVKLALLDDLPVAPVEGAESSVGDAPSSDIEAPTTAVAQSDDAGAVLNLDNVNLLSLLVAFFTILIVVSLLLIVQIRTLPRSTLVYNILWAVIVGLLFYLLYGLGLIPGARWLGDSLGSWAAGVVVFMGMIVPLLWLQLRVETPQNLSSEDTTTTPS